MHKFNFKEVSITIEGDYYQVIFDDGYDQDDEPYVMIQRQFEIPDEGKLYFESLDESLIGHHLIKSASLSSEILTLQGGTGGLLDVEIKFKASKKTYLELVHALNDMIPNIIMIDPVDI